MRTLAVSLGMLLVASGIVQAEQPASRPSEIAAERAKRVKAAVKSFRLELNYNGPEAKPFYRLILSVPPIRHDRSNPFYRLVQVKEAQAEKIVDHLADDGFLDGAHNLLVKVQRPPHTMPGYTLTVLTKEMALREDLGWGLPMLRRLGGLRKVLDGEAAKAMRLLLGRLSGLRAQWEKEAGGGWTALYADEEWYKRHDQPEQIFRGTLGRHHEPEVSTLMRPHRYKLGDRFLYPGRKHDELESLVGRKVELRGKPYDVQLEGQSVREIWPAAIRAARP